MRNIEINKKYKHFKGHIYKVLMIVKSADNLKEQVVYENVETNEKWVRSLEEFSSLVDKEKYPNVSQKYRFEEIKDEQRNNRKYEN